MHIKYDKNPKISIIVPAFNEEVDIERCLTETLNFFKLGYEGEILVSIDGSQDRTSEIASECAKKNSRIKVLPASDVRLGKGGAIRRSIAHAEGDIICMIDVDISTHPSQLPLLINEIINGDDIALGSRYREGARVEYDPLRLFLSKSYNYLFRLILSIDIHDTQCGFKAFKRSVFLDLESDIHSNGFAFDVDFIANAWKKGYKIKEVPVEWHQARKTSLHISDIPKMFWDLIKIRRRLSK